MVAYRGKQIGTRPVTRKLLFLKGYGYLWLALFIVACKHRFLHLLLF